MEDLLCRKEKFYPMLSYLLDLRSMDFCSNGLLKVSRLPHTQYHQWANDFYNSNYSITRIALNNGFYSLEYYSEIFSKIIGVSPRVYLNYCKSRFSISYEELDIISSNLILIKSVIDKTNRYRKNKKPEGIPVLKRSIFK